MPLQLRPNSCSDKLRRSSQNNVKRTTDYVRPGRKRSGRSHCPPLGQTPSALSRSRDPHSFDRALNMRIPTMADASWLARMRIRPFTDRRGAQQAPETEAVAVDDNGGEVSSR
jgi:hypothetical protein